MIRIGIFGYGNLGKGVECAVAKNPDMELVGVFTRRDPSTVAVKSFNSGNFLLVNNLSIIST